jgi:WD40 repeat protein
LYSVDWSPDGTLLLTSGNQGQVTIWDPSDLSLLVELESPDWVITARFTPDGKKVLFSGGGNVPQSVRQVEIWGVP